MPIWVLYWKVCCISIWEECVYNPIHIIDKQNLLKISPYESLSILHNYQVFCASKADLQCNPPSGFFALILEVKGISSTLLFFHIAVNTVTIMHFFKIKDWFLPFDQINFTKSFRHQLSLALIWLIQAIRETWAECCKGIFLLPLCHQRFWIWQCRC